MLPIRFEPATIGKTYMGIFLRLLFLTAFSWVGYVLYTEVQTQAHLPTPDNNKVVLLFAGAILDGAAVALVLTLLVVPAVGERIGAYFFNPSEKIEHDRHADAIAKLAQGDFEGAIDDYQDIYAKDPSDTLALSEIARICCRDLGDTARAATVIERALEGEWPHEQGSFLGNRLADIYLLQDDAVRARQILIQIAENLDGTKFAANAQHRLHEIDRALEAGVKPISYLEGSEDAVPAPEPAASEDDSPSI
jgi:tetratricopeptide (TPR) repeat protein